MAIAVSLVLFLYINLLIMLIVGWRFALRPTVPANSNPAMLAATVIIAVRNEEASLGSLLEDLRKQSYANEDCR